MNYQQQQQQQQLKQQQHSIKSKLSNNDIQLHLLPEASRSAPDLSSPKLTTQTSIPSSSSISSSSSSTTKQTNQTISNNIPHLIQSTSSHSLIHLNNHHHPTHQRSQSHFNPPSTSHHHPNPSIQFERRFQALLEIIETENGYLRDLKRLDEYYLSKIDSATNLKLYQKQIIRRNIAQVIELAERFSRRISIAIGANPPTTLSVQPTLQLPPSRNLQTPYLELDSSSKSNLIIRDEVELDRIIERLAKAFISESPIFTIYEEFCAKHTEAADLIRSFESTPEWHSLLQQSNHCSPSSESFNLNPSNSTNSPPSPGTISKTMNQNNNNNLPTIRLSLQDYIIKPIQRIMRYPMLLNGLLKQMNDRQNLDSNRARERVQQALWAMKQVAEGVDEAKSLREIELKTELIASRMELHSSYRAAFVCLLGQIKLVGSLHILYHGPNLDPSEAFKIKYYGIFLYQTHLVVVKVKRATVYEPRHWFPIRYFDLADISDSSGLMPYSFSLKYRQHTFEFGATCEQEKRCWMNKFRELKAEIDHLRSIQIMSAIPISDDSIVSSINLNENSNLPSSIEGPPRNGSPIDEDPMSDEHTPTTPAAATQSRVSQRLSRNVNTLLGRTAEVAQAAIDLKLTEVFSDVLLCARLQDGGVESVGRTRTLSTSGSTSAKRNSQAVITNRFGGNNTLGSSNGGGDRKIKRMSYMEPNIHSRETVPPLPRLLDSSPETTASMSTSSSLRRARSGPALVSNRSSSSVNRSDQDDLPPQSQRPAHHRARSRNHSAIDPTTTGHLVGESSPSLTQDSQAIILQRSSSPEIQDESPINSTTLVGDQAMPKSLNNNNNGNTNHGNSHFGSSNLWFPGLKMVRRLSRVGAKNKKEHEPSMTSPVTVGDHQLQPPDQKESNDRIHRNQQSNSNSSTKSREQNEPSKKLIRRMNRQASAPNPSHFSTPSTITPGSTSNGHHYHQNTFKRVFMKRNRSSGSNSLHPRHHHQHQLHLVDSSSSNSTVREKENDIDPSLLDDQKLVNSDMNPNTTANCNTGRAGNDNNSNNIASGTNHQNSMNTSKSSSSTPSSNSSFSNLGSSSTLGNGVGGNPFGSMLRSIMRMTPLSDLGSSTTSNTPTSASSSRSCISPSPIASHSQSSLINHSLHLNHSSPIHLSHHHSSDSTTASTNPSSNNSTF